MGVPAGGSAGVGRRGAGLGAALGGLGGLLGGERGAGAAADGARPRGLALYVKKRRSTDLAEYVPPLLQARTQLAEAVGAAVAAAEPASEEEEVREQLEGARDLLREGAFKGFRENLRAAAAYGAEGTAEAEAAAGVLKSLESLDNDLRLAVKRGGRRPNLPVLRQDVAGSVASFDRFFSLLPADVLAEAEAVVRAVDEPAPAPADGAEAAAPVELGESLF